MRLRAIIVWGLLGSGLATAAQAQAGKVAPAILRVPEVEMARRVISKVQPDRTMTAQAVSGTVVLSEVVDREGFIEHISVLSGPLPARAAAVFAARQWSYKPYVVDGQAVEVETTATLELAAEGGAVQTQPGPAAPHVAESKMSATVETRARPSSPRPSEVAYSKPSSPIAANPTKNEPRAPVGSVFAKPQIIASASDPEAFPASSRPGYRVQGGPHAVLESPLILLPVSSTTSLRMPSQWRLARRVGPVYPAPAELAGIEGIVVVEGVVKRDGTLHSVTAVSGPKELRQAAVDAAAQWEFSLNHAGDPQDTAVRESIEFLLRGPAHVPAEVMAGRIERSVQPNYPATAQAAGVTGSVVVHVLISRQGQVEKAAAVSGPALLRDAALAAVKQWTWKPFLRNGVDQEVDTDVVVAFTMQWAGVQ